MVNWFQNLPDREKVDYRNLSLHLHKSANINREEQRMGDALEPILSSALGISFKTVKREFTYKPYRFDFAGLNDSLIEIIEIKVHADNRTIKQIQNYAWAVKNTSDCQVAMTIVAKTFSPDCVKSAKILGIKLARFVENSNDLTFRLAYLGGENALV